MQEGDSQPSRLWKLPRPPRPRLSFGPRFGRGWICSSYCPGLKASFLDSFPKSLLLVDCQCTRVALFGFVLLCLISVVLLPSAAPLPARVSPCPGVMFRRWSIFSSLYLFKYSTHAYFNVSFQVIPFSVHPGVSFIPLNASAESSGRPESPLWAPWAPHLPDPSGQ